MSAAPAGTNRKLYSDDDPMLQATFPAKIDLLREIDAFARALDPRVVQVSATIAASHQEVLILRPEDTLVTDTRPMSRLNISVIVEENGKRESGGMGGGGRAGLMGQQIAAKGVTVLDDGTIPDRRGSITVDDEGTPSAKNTLIEDGVLVGYMQDRQNARLMGVAPTGNGRRESFAHAPMPRMTNTYMLAGDAAPESLVADLKDGIYAVGFGGGQVDITNGKFVFSCTEAYRVKNGMVGAPVKGATLIGDGATALKQIRGIGNDLALDPGIGNCGKAGQWVPVGVGQPSLLIGGLTVGGAAA
jgi:predicted Zn-dependent protease